MSWITVAATFTMAVAIIVNLLIFLKCGKVFKIKKSLSVLLAVLMLTVAMLSIAKLVPTWLNLVSAGIYFVAWTVSSLFQFSRMKSNS
jgi:hypothetical protein